jgi:hypothetical protein
LWPFFRDSKRVSKAKQKQTGRGEKNKFKSKSRLLPLIRLLTKAGILLVTRHPVFPASLLQVAEQNAESIQTIVHELA